MGENELGAAPPGPARAVPWQSSELETERKARYDASRTLQSYDAEDESQFIRRQDLAAEIARMVNPAGGVGLGAAMQPKTRVVITQDPSIADRTFPEGTAVIVTNTSGVPQDIYFALEL